MYIVTVNKFLCCFKLETGGYALGWLGIILSVALLALEIVGISFLIAASGFSVDSIADTLLTQIQQLNVDAGWLKAMDSQTLSDSMPREGSAVVIIATSFLAFLTLYFFTLFTASIMLVVGTRAGNYDRLVPFLIVIAIGIFSTFFGLAPLTWQAVLFVVISVTVGLYLYICVYSLYIKFRRDMRYKFPEEF